MNTEPMPTISVIFEAPQPEGKRITFPPHDEWPEVPPCPVFPDPWETLVSALREAMNGVADKDVAQLTDLEKLAIFHAAGIPLRVVPNESMDGLAHVETCVRVGLIKVDGKFIVGRES